MSKFRIDDRITANCRAWRVIAITENRVVFVCTSRGNALEDADREVNVTDHSGFAALPGMCDIPPPDRKVKVVARALLRRRMLKGGMWEYRVFDVDTAAAMIPTSEWRPVPNCGTQEVAFSFEEAEE